MELYSQVDLPSGLKFKIRKDNRSGDEKYIAGRLLSGEEYTPENFEIGERDTVIDIGAHIGRFSVYAAKLANTGQVYCYEPGTSNFTLLQENITLNNLKNVQVYKLGVGADFKEKKLYFANDNAENTMYLESKNFESVKCVPLSAVFQNNRIETCNFLKIDCEGAEYDILFNTPKNIFEKIDKIVLEYHDHIYQGKNLFDLVWLLNRCGYKLKVKRGAFYTGILFARKAGLPGSVVSSLWLTAANYFQVFVIDLGHFLAKLSRQRAAEFFHK